MSDQPRPRVSLRLVDHPRTGSVVTAPPILIASTHTVDYCCAHCSTVLMHADRGQIHNLIIKCNECGSYNSTDL
jgi:hypothetical protein